MSGVVIVKMWMVSQGMEGWQGSEEARQTRLYPKKDATDENCVEATPPRLQHGPQSLHSRAKGPRKPQVAHSNLIF
jgi:hypothetical protein